MSDQAELLSKLKKLLQERFSIDPSNMTESSRLGDLGIDSLHIVDVLLDVETELDVTFENLSLPPNPTLLEICEEISRAAVKVE